LYARLFSRIYDSSKEFLKCICVMIKTLMVYGCRIHWDSSVWYLSIYSRELVETLKPRLTDPLNDKEWLKGFIDAEGSIYEWVHKNNKTYYQISITNNKKISRGNMQAIYYDYIYSLASLLKRSDSTHGGCGPPEGRVTQVRKERVAAASSLPVVRQGICRAATPLGITAESI